MQKKLKISHHKLTFPHCRQNVEKEWLFICTTIEDVKYSYICSLCDEITGIFNNKVSETKLNEFGKIE